MKNVKVLMRNTVFEIDDVAWINGFAEKACFKVKMRTCRTPCISTESNGLPCFDDLIFGNQGPRQMTVDRFEAVGMTNH